MRKLVFTVLFTLCISAIAIAQKSNYVEVLYFHRTNRCHTCTAIDSTAREYIKKAYKKELASGDVTFTSIDFQIEKENVLVLKYAVEGPTFLIIYHNKKKEIKYDLTDIGFENAISNPAKLKAAIKEKIDEFFR